MELAGHWEPGVMQGLTEDQQGLGDKTGWFTFPTVDGGQGDPTAALGGEIEIPTLDGSAKIRIPAETQTGRVFRLRGKGMSGW